MPNELRERSEPGVTRDIGERLGRIAFRPSDDIQHLHTSVPAAWQGAFMTHVRTKPGFSFDGSWSWLRLSAKLLPGSSGFPRWTDAAPEPASARIQVGMPGAPYSGYWAAATESASLFIDPALFESASHASYSDVLVSQAARHLHEDGIIEHLMRALLADIVAGSPDGPTFGETIIGLILQRLHAFRPASPQLRGSRLSPAELRRLRSYVTENLSSAIHLGDLAHQLGISPRHLSRIMRATLGITPHRYVVECRVEHARHLLTAGNLSCEEIAGAAGFADHSHMSATFRRVLDATPLQVRHNAP